jgi:hypothetical protein
MILPHYALLATPYALATVHSNQGKAPEQTAVDVVHELSFHENGSTIGGSP